MWLANYPDREVEAAKQQGGKDGYQYAFHHPLFSGTILSFVMPDAFFQAVEHRIVTPLLLRVLRTEGSFGFTGYV